MRTNNRECKPLLRGTLVAVDSTWWPGPGADQEHQSCTIQVWCPFCRRFHTHGWNPRDDGRTAEHRVAHCHDPASPFHATGYYITVWRKSDPEYAAHIVPPGKAIVRQTLNRPTIQEPALPDRSRSRRHRMSRFPRLSLSTRPPTRLGRCDQAGDNE